MKVKIKKTDTVNPDGIGRDLGKKFQTDLIDLVIRSAAIMEPAVGVDVTASVIMSLLADCGVELEKASKVPSGNFLQIVAASAKRKGRL